MGSVAECSELPTACDVSLTAAVGPEFFFFFLRGVKYNEGLFYFWFVWGGVGVDCFTLKNFFQPPESETVGAPLTTSTVPFPVLLMTVVETLV